MTIFYVEESRTPIYHRIARSLGTALARAGHEVLTVKPAGFDEEGFEAFLRTAPAQAVYVANAGGNLIQRRRRDGASFGFEAFPGRTVFLHQDTILGGMSLLEAADRLRAWKRLGARGVHLCIEPDNVHDLHALGIERAEVVPHATEFEPVDPTLDHFDHGAVFVGHVLPENVRPATASGATASLGEAALRLRRADLGVPLRPVVREAALARVGELGDGDERGLLEVATTQWLRNQVTALSMPLRGWLLDRCALAPLTLVGGDPAYLHGVDRQLRLARTDIRYEPARFEPEVLRHLYRTSQVSLNLSSMQFDHAVVNRVHDVFASGGLCLTDAFPGLPELTSRHADIGYRGLDELRDKAVHFSRPERRRERVALIREVQRDIRANSGYPLLVQRLQSALARG